MSSTKKGASKQTRRAQTAADKILKAFAERIERMEARLDEVLEQQTGAAMDTTQAANNRAGACATCGDVETRLARVENIVGAMNHGAQWVAQPATQSDEQ